MAAQRMPFVYHWPDLTSVKVGAPETEGDSLAPVENGGQHGAGQRAVGVEFVIPNAVHQSLLHAPLHGVGVVCRGGHVGETAVGGVGSGDAQGQGQDERSEFFDLFHVKHLSFLIPR